MTKRGLHTSSCPLLTAKSRGLGGIVDIFWHCSDLSPSFSAVWGGLDLVSQVGEVIFWWM
eukprot:CAMPEP_0116856522 /NCGR_PEP_ID=MMETSP0418-20121206/19964_1 /TAXON_ID=1158023 /ORGANISM="Astrosyne radiata, Strain 13vi08-1A" /LENGTH=59 /DNA_ID=CAMNT_0004489943 /DNA_START=28 /DNA_END=204 /DNA_ORIENTATION=+